MSIDLAREWLERLHVSNAPEADMALDLLGRLDEAEETVSADSYDALLEEIKETETQLSGVEAENDRMESEIAKLNEELGALEEALGADGPDEAIAMARTLREAFE
jgi:chromosome segregation ATPase